MGGVSAMWKRAAAFCLVSLSTVVFIPSIDSEFVWDDDDFVYENPHLKDVSGLRAIWFSKKTPDYYPLTLTTLWLERRLWGPDSAIGYRITNILLHAAGSYLLWQVLLVLKIRAAWLAAALFCCHPVNIESVVWITQRKNVLSVALAMFAVLLYLRALGCERAGEWGRARWLSYAGLGVFVLALLSKTAVAPLPVVLALLVYWRDRELGMTAIRRLLPAILMAAVLSVVTCWFQQEIAIGGTVIRSDSWGERLCIAAQAVLFYASKAILPLELSFVYTDSYFAFWGPECWYALGACGVAMCLALLGDGQLIRALRYGTAAYVIMLLPILGFIDIYFMRYALVSDHWQYPALPILCTLLSSVFVSGNPARSLGMAQRLRLGLGLTWLAAFCVMTWQGQARFASTEDLWTDTLRRNPDCFLAHNNLGFLYMERGDAYIARAHFRSATMSEPSYAEAHLNLGLSERMLGSAAPSVYAPLLRAVRLDPESPLGHYNLGLFYLERQEYEPAVYHLRESMRLSPQSIGCALDLAVALDGMGKGREAIECLRSALETGGMDPETTQAMVTMISELRQQE